MAKVKVLRENGMLVEVDPTTDTMDAKINVSGPSLIGRATTGEGGHEELTPGNMTEHTAPVEGDYLVIFQNASNEPQKLDFGSVKEAFQRLSFLAAC